MTDLPANYEILSNGHLAHGAMYCLLAVLGLITVCIGIRVSTKAQSADTRVVAGASIIFTGAALILIGTYNGLPRVLAPGYYVLQPCRGLHCP
jgi:branched-subunit amino acid permease